MNRQTNSEKGQALVLIVLAIFGLMGLIALAIDGGNAFADRRQAQNAADAGALTAARYFAMDQSKGEAYYENLVLTPTTADGYSNTLPRSIVVLKRPLPEAGTNCPPFSVAGKIFQVDIDSFNPTWFGGVVGISQVHNHVTTQAVGCGPVIEIMYAGNTVVALNKTSCRSLEISGSSNTIVTSDTNQGLYDNSNCTGNGTNDPQNALYGGSGTVSTPSARVVGGVYTPGIFAPTTVQTGSPTIDKNYIWPNVTNAVCGSTAIESPTGTLNHGIFPGTNTAWHNDNFPPAGVTHLNPGLYCLDKDLKITNNNAVLTGNDVTIVMRSGIISIQGGSINLTATASTPYPGLLFYIPFSNTGGSVSINGGATSSYSGSILAPGSHISINGGSGTSGPFQTQLIGDTVSISGSGTLNLSYNSIDQYHATLSAGIQLLK